MKYVEVVAAVIKRDGKILAAQRGYGPFKGKWEFPGGKLEAGESPESALRRELREELNTEITIDKFITTVEYDYPDFHLTLHCYFCSMTSDRYELMEHDSATWLSMQDLKTVDWLPADIGVIEIILSQSEL